MPDILFIIFAVMTVVASLGVVMARNPVNAAMGMIGAFVGTAAIYILLGAYLIAALQILVYAGAVVVLFLFIIMLLDVDKQRRTRINRLSALGALTGFALLLLGLWVLFLSPLAVDLPSYFPPETTPASLIRTYGELLFTKYLLPVQVAGFLLLAAMIGVIYISKRTKATPEEVEATNTAETTKEVGA